MLDEPHMKQFPRLILAIGLSLVVHVVLLMHPAPKVRPAPQEEIRVRLVEPGTPAAQAELPSRVSGHARSDARILAKPIATSVVNAVAHASAPPLLSTSGHAPSIVAVAQSPLAAAQANVVALPAPTPAGNPGSATTGSPLPVSAPRFLGDRNNPSYPERSRDLGEAGLVELKVTIGAEGQVLDVVVFKSSGYPLLDSAAQDLARRGPYSPAHRGGEAIKSVLRLTIPFKLTPG